MTIVIYLFFYLSSIIVLEKRITSNETVFSHLLCKENGNISSYKS